MRLSSTLSIYIGRTYLFHFGVVLSLFLFLIFMFDGVELMRRASGRPEVSFGIIIEMALLKLPHMGQQTFPFAVLFASMATFWRLTRSHELVVTRAAGVSAWQFLLPVLTLTLVLGAIRVTALNPISSTLLARFERIEGVLLKGHQSALALSGGGLWLRQAGGAGQAVVRANSISLVGAEVELKGVVVFSYQGADRFFERIDAESARLRPGFWLLRNAWIHRPELPRRFEKEHLLETDLTLTKIQDSFAAPETMSFWDLPGFIETLRAAGFSGLRHRLHLHGLLAAPFLMMAMVLLGAIFTLRHTRRGGTTIIVSAGVMIGFLVYFLSDVVFALGLSNSIPVILAAWTPAGVTSLLGASLLLHLEDG